MSFSKISIHVVWSTKKRRPCLSNEIRPLIMEHIVSNAKTKDIYIDIINCHLDHVHCLLSLGKDQTLSDTIRLLKGESSHWVNKEKLVKGRFAWQEDYYAISVCESSRDNVIRYIRNQDLHHQKKPFQKEYEKLMRILAPGEL